MCCEVRCQHRILLTHIYQQYALTAAYGECIRDMKGQRVLQGSSSVLNEGEPSLIDYASRTHPRHQAKERFLTDHLSFNRKNPQIIFRVKRTILALTSLREKI